jgi:hypothetical protein
MLTAMRRASSWVRRCAAERRSNSVRLPVDVAYGWSTDQGGGSGARRAAAGTYSPSSGSLITAGSRSSSTSSSSSSSSSSSTLGSRGGAAVPTRLGQVVMSGLSLDVITSADISTRAPQRRSASASLARLQSRQVNIFPLARAKRPIASPGVRTGLVSVRRADRPTALSAPAPCCASPFEGEAAWSKIIERPCRAGLVCNVPCFVSNCCECDEKVVWLGFEAFASPRTRPSACCRRSRPCRCAKMMVEYYRQRASAGPLGTPSTHDVLSVVRLSASSHCANSRTCGLPAESRDSMMKYARDPTSVCLNGATSARDSMRSLTSA